jgi:LacI family transcriptional regulator
LEARIVGRQDSTLDMTPRRRVTLQVIAERLDVSTATVSLALRDNPVVAHATRNRVQEVARELGYVYNRSAASLRTARTNIIAFAVHDVTNPYFAEILAAVEESVSASGRTVLLGTTAEDPGRQDRILATLKEYRPDGMIICPAGGSKASSLEQLVSARIPLVQISREIPEAGLDFVGADDEHGIALAVEHLVALGHVRIGMIGGTAGTSTGQRRHQGWRDALARRGLLAEPALLQPGFGTRETGLRGVQALLDLPEPPTAAVCFNDLTAFGAMLGLRHRGLEAGRDFSIVGCDDVKEASQWYPALTTISNRQHEMGRLAAELLTERMGRPEAPTRRILLEPHLVVRGTTARPV